MPSWPACVCGLALSGLGLSCASDRGGDKSDAAIADGQSAQADTASEDALDDVGPSYEAPAVVPRWTAQEVSDQISADLPFAVPNLVQLVNTYLWMMESGDTDCPGSATQLTGVDPERGCTSESGFWYYGVASYEPAEEEGSTRQVLSGDFELRTPEDLSLACGGHVGVEWNLTGDGGQVAMGTLLGTWAWEGAEDSLANTVSASLVVGRVLSPGASVASQLWLEGGLSTARGSWTFEEFSFTPGCEGRPVGRVYVYDAEVGHWYTLDLEEDCSGCGEVSFLSKSMGRVCPTWTGMAHQVGAALATP